jgi:hypothetical protein
MSVFVLHRRNSAFETAWFITECDSRESALECINANHSKDVLQVIEGVRLKLEPVTQVTQYQFARGT